MSKIDATTFWSANTLKRLAYLEQSLREEHRKLRDRESKHLWDFARLGGPADKLTKLDNKQLLAAIKAHDCPPDTRSMGGALGLAFYLWGERAPAAYAWHHLPEKMFGTRACEQIFYGKAIYKRRAHPNLDKITPTDVANAIAYFLENGKCRFPTIGARR